MDTGRTTARESRRELDTLYDDVARSTHSGANSEPRISKSQEEEMPTNLNEKRTSTGNFNDEESSQENNLTTGVADM